MNILNKVFTSITGLLGLLFIGTALFYIFGIPMLSPYHEDRMFIHQSFLLIILGLVFFLISISSYGMGEKK